MRFRSCALVIAAIALTPTLAVAQAPLTPPSEAVPLFRWFLPHLIYRGETSNAVGREGGLSTLEFFIPLADAQERDELIFRDFRFLAHHETKSYAACVGGGYRCCYHDYDLVVGGYGFYDYHFTPQREVHQGVAGLEVFGDLWEARFNGYLPFGHTRQLVGQRFLPDNRAIFRGNDLLVNGGVNIQTIQQALPGFDAECGLRLYACSWLELRSFLGGYFYDAKGTNPIAGPRIRMEARICDHAAIEVNFQHDEVFKSTCNVVATVSFPRLSGRRYHDGPDAPLAPYERLGDPVVRTNHVAIQQQVRVRPVAPVAAVDPLTNSSMVFLHVDGTGAQAGTGTFERPYRTLSQALADARTPSGNLVIYDRNRSGLTSNQTLASGTRLLSNAPIQRIETSNAGLVTLPFSGVNPELSALPTISGTITVAHNTTVSGFNITPTAGNAGITSTQAVSNVQVDNNVFTGGSQGISLADVGGTVRVRNNRITGATSSALSVGVQSSSSATLFLNDNTITSPGQNGIEVLVNTSSGTSSTAQATIAGNTITGAGNNGIALRNNMSSSLRASVNGNTVSNSAASALSLTSANGSNTVRVAALNNLFRNSTNPDVLADYSLGSSSNVALDFNGNSALPNGYRFQEAGGTVFNVVNLNTFSDRNTGPLSTSGTIGNISVLP